MHALAEQFPTRWVFAPICESEMAANLHRISDATSGVMAGSLCLLEEVPQDAVCRAFALGPKGTQRPVEVGLAVDRERCGYTDHGLRALLAPGALAEGERLRVECVK